MTGDDDETPRPRRSMGLFDLPVWRDWVFWLTVAPALVMTVGALGTQLDPGDGPPEPWPVFALLLTILLLMIVLLFAGIPSLVRRVLRRWLGTPVERVPWSRPITPIVVVVTVVAFGVLGGVTPGDVLDPDPCAGPRRDFAALSASGDRSPTAVTDEERFAIRVDLEEAVLIARDHRECFREAELGAALTRARRWAALEAE